MVNNLVKFPVPGDEWEAVKGGPGMYVLAVLPRGSERDPCSVGSAIVLLRPDGRLLTPTAPLWPTDESRGYDVRLIEDAALLFEEKGERMKAAVMRAQFPVTDLSVEVLHATRVGATELTLKSKETGEYWQAGWSDLTPAGVLQLHQAEVAFMRAPTLLTFLADEEENR